MQGWARCPSLSEAHSLIPMVTSAEATTPHPPQGPSTGRHETGGKGREVNGHARSP